MSDVWDRLYTQKTRNVRRRRNKLSPYVIRQQVTQGSVYKNGMNTVSPFKGASVRPNTAYMRRIERYIGHKAIPIDMNSSSQSTIILNAVDVSCFLSIQAIPYVRHRLLLLYYVL